MRVTLRDIALAANVSSSTVSRVLNNYAFVDDETRNRVWQVAKELGYPLENLRSKPDAIASILVTEMGHNRNRANNAEFNAQVLKGIEAITSERVWLF